MRRVLLLGALALTVTATWTYSTVRAAEDPKFTIKEVMNKAHKKGAILGKVIDGSATKEEKDQLVELYTALGQNKPPKGDLDDWKTRTDELTGAAKAAAAGEAGAVDRLKKATNCGACHMLHKK